MTQNEHDRDAGAKLPGHRPNIFNLHPLEDFLRRHCGEFGTAKKICTESLKMSADEAPHFPWCLFIGKRNGNIALRQMSIFPGSEPGTKPKERTKGKEKPQR